MIYPIIDCSVALVKKSLKRKMPWADTSNYSFLQPSKRKNKNKYFVFYFNLLFNLLNSLLIFIQIMFSWHYIILNIILTLITMRIYEKKIN